MKHLIFLALIFSSVRLMAQKTDNPGLVQSYTQDAIVLTKTGQHIDSAIDGNITTYWESEAPLPSGYLNNADLNCFLVDNKSRILAEVNNAFDGNTDSFEPIERQLANDYRRGFIIPFKSPDKIYLLSVKLACSSPVTMSLIADGQLFTEFIVNPGQNYQLLNFYTPYNKKVEQIVLASSEKFQLFELAALNSLPFVTYTLDLKKIMPIGQIYSRHMNQENVTSAEVLVSNDQKSWIRVAELQPAAVAMIPTVLKEEVNARFIQLRFGLQMKEYTKAALWELAVYDAFGPFGKAQIALENNQPLNERIGLNSVWGWGFNTYSDEISAGFGPDKFANIFRKIRLYHNILWDITMPGQSANYAQMLQGKGTTANWWLNWEREYGYLNQKGFDVSAALMFKNKTIPVSSWKNPQQDGYLFGNEFAAFFGNASGHQLIESVELGNEPWDYPPAFYQTLSEAMLQGVKNADKSLFTLPAAFQATFPYLSVNETNDYISDYISNDQWRNFDALNAHFYAHTFSENGERISVNPEDKRASINGIINLVRYRNAVAPELPIWITEFGYDSEGGDENCTHSECVSEKQQAAWGVRAALLLLRNGADRVYWYFYANEDNAEGLHSRSGLLSSSLHGFKEKQSYRAFKQLMEQAGNLVLKEVLLVYHDVYCLKFSDPNSDKAYAMMWYSGANDPDETVLVKTRILPVNQRKFVIDGSFNNNWINLDENLNGLLINGYPTLYEIEP